jgi:hypothetical protein
MIIHKGWDINEHATGRFKNGKPIIGAIFQNGLNDIEPDGSFVPCDAGISEVTQGVTHLKMNRGRMGELRFGDSSHPNSFLVKIKNKALKGVSFKYTGADGNSMTANNGRPLCHFANGISIESTPYYRGVKMDIIIDDPITAPLEYPFSVKTYGQDYEFIEENGGATLGGEDQSPIFIKPPYAVDANGDIGPVTIHYTGMDGNLITFKKVVDETWFRQAAAPVRIDPDVTIDDDSGTIIDTLMYGLPGWHATNWGISAIGQTLWRTASERMNALVNVDLSAISGTVLSSHFGIHVYLGSFPIDIEWNRVLKTWVEGTKNGSTAALGEPTWDDQVYNTVPWNTGGCLGDGTDRQAVVEGSGTITGFGTDQPLSITNATAQAWLDDSADNHGIIISTPTFQNGKSVNWRSSDSGAGEKIYYYIEWIAEAAGNINRKLGRGLNRGIGRGL